MRIEQLMFVGLILAISIVSLISTIKVLSNDDDHKYRDICFF